MKVSFIIPAFNEEKYILKTLKSVYGLEGLRNFEIIVVDNNSTDNTVRVVRERFPGVTILSEKRKGPNWARQKGLSSASGDLIIFFDADIKVPEKWDRHFPPEPETTHPDYLRELLQEQLKEFGEIDHESFFSLALLGFYSPMWEGLGLDAGHIIYRLSDSVSREKRKKMMIYPSQNGSIEYENGMWDSLEDWRKQWEKLHAVIPEFIKLLPPGDPMHHLANPDSS